MEIEHFDEIDIEVDDLFTGLDAERPDNAAFDEDRELAQSVFYLGDE